MSIVATPRNSVMELNQVYFWTATIKDWNTLLEPTIYKEIIIDSLSHLIKQNLITVYGFVIMPNHVHLLWEMLDMNGNEKPYASFLKFTAHRFEKQLQETDLPGLKNYRVSEKTRKYRFWQ